MKALSLCTLAVYLFFTGCSTDKTVESEHNHNSTEENHSHSGESESHEGHSHAEGEKEGNTHFYPSEHHEEESKEAVSSVYWSSGYELFFEHFPLIKNTEGHISLHITRLEDYKPLGHAHIHAKMIVNGQKINLEEPHAVSEGIFELHVKPLQSGNAEFVIEINTHTKTEYIKAYAKINSTNEDAEKELKMFEAVNSTKTRFTKEQAWNTDFATVSVNIKSMSDVIKASGELIAAPGEETIVPAEVSGIVKFSGIKCLPGQPVSSGESIMNIKASGIDNNINSKYQQAKAEFEKDKSNFERAKKLLEKQFISQKDFDGINSEYITARSNYEAVAKYVSQNGQSVKASNSGYIKEILVNDGEYVEAGKPLFSITRNKKVMIKAEVSQKYISRLSSVKSASFRSSETDEYFNTKELNGRLVTSGKALSSRSPLIPLYFEIDNKTNLLPGAFLEVSLLTETKANVLAVPRSAIIEEFGQFSVFVQKGGESYEKRMIKVGRFDGENYEIVSGLIQGERIVSRGAFQIKIASQSSAIPGHNHQH